MMKMDFRDLWNEAMGELIKSEQYDAIEIMDAIFGKHYRALREIEE
jgi:hypothetical protein